MSTWLTKSSNPNKNYIVVKHKLRGINFVVQGVKFRDGYAVVEKDSKVYFMLKKMPMLELSEEYPIVYLRKLKCVTRASDVKTIFGPDVYRHYLAALNTDINKEKVDNKIQEELEHLELGGCAARSNLGELCQGDALNESPSGYCMRHLLDDPKLESLGIKVPRMIAKDEKAAIKEKVFKQLSKIKKEVTKNGENVGLKTAES